MRQRGEDLTFGPESREDIVGVQAAPQHLECDVLLVLAVTTFGKEDGARAAAADLAGDPMDADAAAAAERIAVQVAPQLLD